MCPGLAWAALGLPGLRGQAVCRSPPLLPSPASRPGPLSPQERIAAIHETIQKYEKKLQERTRHHMG